jgi:hypothetical protein
MRYLFVLTALFFLGPGRFCLALSNDDIFHNFQKEQCISPLTTSQEEVEFCNAAKTYQDFRNDSSLIKDHAATCKSQAERDAGDIYSANPIFANEQLPSSEQVSDICRNTWAKIAAKFNTAYSQYFATHTAGVSGTAGTQSGAAAVR